MDAGRELRDPAGVGVPLLDDPGAPPERATTGSLELRVLGEPELVVDGRATAFPPGRPGRLLAVLAVARGRVVGTERLVDEVWGEQVPADARSALHTTVGRARRALGEHAVLLERHRAGYRLQGCVLDSDRYLAAASALAQVPDAQVPDRADELEARWRGPAWGSLADLAAGERLRLEEARVSVRQRRCAALVEIGRAAETLGDLRALVAENPLREEAVALLMTAQHRVGDVSGALATYAEHREHLVDELGLDPSPRLVTLHGEVLRREPAPAAAVAAAAGSGPGTAAPPPAPPAPPVPPALPGLHGRAAQLDSLAHLLDRHRCVTVVGPGGVGKTTLVRAATYGGPHWWVDLTTTNTSSDVARLVAEAVGAEVYPGSDVAASVAGHLRDRSGVLVLDNCEHVLLGAAEVAELVLTAGAGVVVLATSRERLGAPAETVLPLPPLRLPGPGAHDSPAVDLFLERARAVAPALGDDPDTRATVADLVRRLDGLPLAIELAANRIGALTLDDLGDHLGDRLDLLRSRYPRTPNRQRTLAATVRWSYDLLDDDTRTAFRRLSVFPGSFDLEAATALLGPAAPMLVADLVDRSLVVGPGTHGPGRYRMLETLRACAAELSPAEETAEVRDRHARWAADAVERAAAELRGPAERQAGGELDRLLPDARAAVHRMLEAGDAATAGRIVGALRWWAYLRLRCDVVAWSEEVLAQDARPAAGVWLAAAAHRWLEGDHAGAARFAQQGAAAAEPGSTMHTAALDTLSDVALSVGDFATADRLSREAHDLATAGGRHTDAAIALVARTLAATYAGRPDPELLDRTHAAAELSGNPTALAFAHFCTGEARAEDDPVAALAALARAAEIAAGVDNRLVVGVCRTVDLAIRARTDPLDDDLLDHCAAVLRLWLDSGNQNLFRTCLSNLAPLLARMCADAELVTLLATVDPRRLDDTGAASAVEGARSRLAPAEFERARAAGAAATLEEAGLAVLDALGRPRSRG